MEWISSSIRSIANKVTFNQESNTENFKDRDANQNLENELDDNANVDDKEVLEINQYAKQLKINSIRSKEFSRLKSMFEIQFFFFFFVKKLLKKKR